MEGVIICPFLIVSTTRQARSLQADGLAVATKQLKRNHRTAFAWAGPSRESLSCHRLLRPPLARDGASLSAGVTN
jgi:hypothetical protein